MFQCVCTIFKALACGLIKIAKDPRILASGLEIRTEHNRRAAENSLGLSTVVGGVYGYDAGARAAHHAADHAMSIKDAVIELGIAPPEAAQRLLDPVVLTDAARSSTLLDAMVAEQQARTRELSPACLPVCAPPSSP